MSGFAESPWISDMLKKQYIDALTKRAGTLVPSVLIESSPEKKKSLLDKIIDYLRREIQ